MKKKPSLLIAFCAPVGAAAVAVTVSASRGTISVQTAIYMVATAMVCAGAVVLLVGLARSRAPGDEPDR